jgi:hypothetical protein
VHLWAGKYHSTDRDVRRPWGKKYLWRSPSTGILKKTRERTESLRKDLEEDAIAQKRQIPGRADYPGLRAADLSVSAYQPAVMVSPVCGLTPGGATEDRAGCPDDTKAEAKI